MATVIYSVSASLDGFIAGPGGDMSWLTPYQGPNAEVDRLASEVGALLVGRRSFDGDDPNRGTEQEGAFGGTWDGGEFVLTSSPPAEPVAGVTFVTDVRDGVERASAAAGDRYVNVLGATTARSCLEAGLLDEILVVTVPVLLGDGTRLFSVTGGREVALDLVRSSSSDGATNAWYRVR